MKLRLLLPKECFLVGIRVTHFLAQLAVFRVETPSLEPADQVFEDLLGAPIGIEWGVVDCNFPQALP